MIREHGGPHEAGADRAERVDDGVRDAGQQQHAREHGQRDGDEPAQALARVRLDRRRGVVRPLRALDSDRVAHRPERYPHRGVSSRTTMTSYGELARTIAEEIAAGSGRRGARAPGAPHARARSRCQPGDGPAGVPRAGRGRRHHHRGAPRRPRRARRRTGSCAVPARRRHLPAGGLRRPGAAAVARRDADHRRAGRRRRLRRRAGGPAGGYRADGAVLHLWHTSGAYNAPYARGVVADARLVRLWSREAGLLVAPGNPRRVRRAADLGGLRVARRPVGTGARSLLDRVTGEAGIVLDASDPEVPRNLDVALAVAQRLGRRRRRVARGGRPVRPRRSSRWPGNRSRSPSAARRSSGLDPLLRALRSAAVRKRIEALGGYDLTGSGQDGALLMARRRAPPRGRRPARRRRPPPPPRRRGRSRRGARSSRSSCRAQGRSTPASAAAASRCWR